MSMPFFHANPLLCIAAYCYYYYYAHIPQLERFMVLRGSFMLLKVA